jgi:transcriptional regulator with XRE-family HTH domain
MPIKTFAKNLRFLMYKKGISQLELSRKLNVSKSAAWHWFNGRSFPASHDTLLRLCDALGIKSIDDFIRRDITQSVKGHRRNTKKISNKVTLNRTQKTKS